ncbi:hypothetical protein ACLBP5_30735, partial [Klebsiella pneumoniae]
NHISNVVSRGGSGYYAARRRVNTPKPICQDSVHAQAVFLASGRTYGRRLLSAALRAEGHDVCVTSLLFL